MGSLPMKKVFDKANKISYNINQKAGFNPLVAIAVVNILVELVKLYKQCKDLQNVQQRLITGRIIFNVKLKRLINKEVKNHNLPSEMKEILFKEFTNEVENITDEEVTTLCSEF